MAGCKRKKGVSRLWTGRLGEEESAMRGGGDANHDPA